MDRSAGVVWMGGSKGRSRLRRVPGPVVLVFLLFTAFSVGGGFGGRALAASTTVTVISGDVEVRHGATGSFVSATDGEVLVAGDAVRTGDGSRAILTYFEGSTVSVEPNTELAIENARPAPAAAAPRPERMVTVTLDDQNSLVIDSQGRANGIDRNGKKHLETPGAQLVKTPDGKLQIVLPNVSDGRLEALVRITGGGEVDVQTTVEDRGMEPVKTQTKVTADTTGQGRASVDVTRTADGRTNVRQSTGSVNSKAPGAVDALFGGKRP